MLNPNRFVKAGRYSLYAYGAKGNNLVNSAYYQLATDFMKEKFIGRSTLRTFVKRGWLAIIRIKGRLWVHEVCPDEITDYLL